MDPILDVASLKATGVIPAEDIDRLELDAPGFVAARLLVVTSEIYSRLRKRYRTPFAAPVPEVVKGWCADIFAPVFYAKRGWNPSDEQSIQIVEAAKFAREQIKEAADAVDGLYDLPLLDSADTSAITKGGPLSYSEASPYSWIDAQADVIRGGGV